MLLLVVGGAADAPVSSIHSTDRPIDRPAPNLTHHTPEHSTQTHPTQSTTNGSPPAYAFVAFDDYRDAEDAIRGRDGYRFEGERLRYARVLVILLFVCCLLAVRWRGGLIFVGVVVYIW